MSTSNFNSDRFANLFSGLNIPAGILCAMIFLLPALGVPSEFMLQDTLKSAVASFATLICALLFFYQQRGRATPLQWHSLLWLPIALMVYALGSILWAHTYLATVEAIRWFIFSLMMWLAINSFTQKNIPLLVWAIHAGTVIACIWAALQFWFDFTAFPQFAGPASTFANRNFFAEYIVCSLPFSVWALASMRESRWLGVVALSIALNVVALMMTGCRAGAIAAIVTIPILIFILWKFRQQFAFGSWKKSQQLLVSLILIGGVWGLGSIAGSTVQQKQATPLQITFQRTTSLVTAAEYGKGTSFSIRAILWRATIDMIEAKPITGVGAGTWEVQVPLYQPSNQMSELDYFAHNEYLQMLSEYGLPLGGAVLSLLLGYLFLTFCKTWKSQGADLQQAPLRAFTLTSMLALLIVSAAGFPWHMAGTTALFAIFLGLLCGSDKRLEKTSSLLLQPLPWKPLIAKIAIAFVACALLLATYVMWQAAVVEYKNIKAIHLGNLAKQFRQAGREPSAQQRAEVLANMHDAIAITPHMRKLNEIVGKQLILDKDYRNSIWIWETIASSRPYIPSVWFRIAHLYVNLGEDDKALEAIRIALQLKTVMLDLKALEIDILSKNGRDAEAKQIALAHFDKGTHDRLVADSAYKLAIKTRDWALGIRAMTLRNQGWPELAAEGHFRLGDIYVQMQDETQALAEFRAGYKAVADAEKDFYRSQVPEPYRNQL